MGCKEMEKSLLLSGLSVTKKSKGNLYTLKPVFWDNGSSVIICSGCSLFMYNTSTGNCLRELFKCFDEIISFQLHPFEPTQLIAITENGELFVYNLQSNEIEYSVQLTLNQKFLSKQKAPKFSEKKVENAEEFDWEKQPLDSLTHRKFLHAEVKAFHNKPSEVFVWTSWCLKDENKCHLSVFTLKSGKHIRLFHLQNTGLKKCHSNFIIGTAQGYEIFVGQTFKHICLVHYDAQKHPFSLTHTTDYKASITCMAFHPTECSFVTGDSMGRIFVWENIFERNPLKDILHWHTLPVHSVFFSKFGNYLFSGGEEHVLVKWSLKSQKKDFLPRMSSTIHQISGAPESSLLSVSTMDNKILILDYSFQNISTIQHFSRWSVLKRKKMNIFTVDPRSNSLVLNGRTGHIQFLSLNEDGEFLYTFDVTNRNFITSTAEHKVENTEVTHAKFSKDGHWLITAELRKDKFTKESRLKFWLYCEKRNSFTLRTNVEFPHDGLGIHSLEMSVDDMVATTGGDKKFCLWTIFDQEQGSKKKKFWAAYSVNKFRNLSCYGADFSKDASLIAVTFGPILTVWETESSSLKCTLSAPNRKEGLKFCKFGNYELSHLVVTASKSIISSWNIITLSLIWTVPIRLSLLISDPFSTFMAVFSADNSLIIFNPFSPAPDLILKNVTNSPVTAAHCALSESGKFCLYFLTANQDLYCLDDADKAESSNPSEAVHSSVTPYTMQLAKIHNRAEFDKRKMILLNKTNKQSVAALLDSAAHTLPNPSLLCVEVLKGLLVFSKNESAGVSSVKEDKNDGAVKIRKNPENSVDEQSYKGENKLLEIVNKIFL